MLDLSRFNFCDRTDLERLKRLVNQYVRFGEFTLASGKSSDYYIDIKTVSTHHDGIELLPRLIASRIPNRVKFIGGVELGAVPLVFGTASYIRHSLKRSISAFVIRKAKKDHGIANTIISPGDLCERLNLMTSDCVLVEDVITTGGTLLRALELVRPIKIVCVFDRKEYCKEFEGYVHLVDSLLTVDDLSLGVKR